MKIPKLSSNYRTKWKQYFGAIPKGYVIHHIDGERDNNRMNNLVCIDRKIHSKYHREHNHILFVSSHLKESNLHSRMFYLEELEKHISKYKSIMCHIMECKYRRDSLVVANNHYPELLNGEL